MRYRARVESARPSERKAIALFVAALLVAGCLLLFPRLGDRALWQDEAETALLARSVLEHGIPWARDGDLLVSSSPGEHREFQAPDYTWRWTPWLQFYAAAASFALLGEGAATARLPFVLFGLASLVLTFRLASMSGRSLVAGAAAATLLLVSVPFLLYTRQCRYYAPLCFFALLLFHEYERALRRERSARIGLVVAITGLVQSHYPAAACLVVSVGAHFALVGRFAAPWRPMLVSAAASALLAVPFLVLLAPNLANLAGAERNVDAGAHLWMAVDHINRFALPLAVVADGAVCGSDGATRSDRQAAATRRVWCDGDRLRGDAAAARDRDAGLLLPLLRHAGAARLRAAGHRRRAGRAVATRCRHGAVRRARDDRCRHTAGARATVRAFAAEPHDGRRDLRRSGRRLGGVRAARRVPVRDHTRRHPGPIEEIAAFLNAHAEPDDVVIATYGDLPLRFHTGLTVVGGAAGEPLDDFAPPRWLIRRPFSRTRDDVTELLGKSAVRFQRIEIARGIAELPWEHRPAPGYHKFRTVTHGPPIEIGKRID